MNASPCDSTQDEFGLRMRPGMETQRARIERAFGFFGFGHCLAASSDRRGHDRTAYFYRQVAIRFAQDARHPMTRVLCRGDVSTFTSLAKTYLAEFRKRKGACS